MTIALDPKFVKVIALWRSTTHDGEREAARKRAEAIAAAAGMSFDDAIAHLKDPTSWTAPLRRSQRQRDRLTKRAAVIAKYGSVEAALAPCNLEQMIMAAVAPWRTPQPKPRERWTHSLDGWSAEGFYWNKMPTHVLAAITSAYPIPATFAAMKAEHEHWEMRNDEIDLVLDEEGHGLGDNRLDIAADVRASMIRDLVEKDMPVSTIEDLHARFAFYRSMENHCNDIEEALFRDLTAIVEMRHLGSDQGAPVVLRTLGANHPSTADRDGQIRDALDADPSRSDRDIARSCRCSPTTVGKARRAMGLQAQARSVHRRGQKYKMHLAPAGWSRGSPGARAASKVEGRPMTHQYERTPSVSEIEAALAALLTAIEGEEKRRSQKPKASAAALEVTAAELTTTDPVVFKIESLIADPVGRACREQIREFGTLLFQITGSTDEMCASLDRVAALNPERVQERTELLDRWWAVTEDGHAIGCP